MEGPCSANGCRGALTMRNRTNACDAAMFRRLAFHPSVGGGVLDADSTESHARGFFLNKFIRPKVIFVLASKRTRKKIFLKGSFALGAASGDGGAGEAGPRFRLTATHSRPVGIKMQAALAAAAKKRAEKLGIEDEVTRSHLCPPHICAATETGPDRGTASVSLLACVGGRRCGDCLRGAARDAALVRAPWAAACSPACRQHSALCVAFVRACSVNSEAPAQTRTRACAAARI